MSNNFKFDKAEQAIYFTFKKDPLKNIDEALLDAKKVYDFLAGSSHHFLDNGTNCVTE